MRLKLIFPTGLYYDIFFSTKGVEVTNTFSLSKLYQYLGNSMENSASQRKIRSFKTFRCLKIKFEGNKTTQGNTHIIYSFKTFLGFKICDAGDFQEVIFTHFIHDVTIRTKF